jgi:hypothetical protein
MSKEYIAFYFGSKGLDPMRMFEDPDGTIYVLDHIFDPLEHGVYICRDCGIHVLIRLPHTPTGKANIYQFRSIDIAKSHAAGETSNIMGAFEQRFMTCEEMCVEDILE